MDWFSSPLTEIFGLPVFWVARIAKIIQFVSGLVIVIEIIGKERVETYADLVRGTLSKVGAAEPFKRLLKDYVRTLRSRFVFGYDHDEPATATYFWIAVWTIGILSGVICTALFVSELLQAGGCPVPLIVVPVFFISMMLGNILFLVLLLLLIVVIYLIFHPIEWSFDIFANHIVRVMERRGLSQVLFTFSLIFLVMSFILELLTS